MRGDRPSLGEAVTYPGLFGSPACAGIDPMDRNGRKVYDFGSPACAGIDPLI